VPPTPTPTPAGNVISACGKITAPGTYTLDRDISAAQGCLVVSANDVTIDLQGHTVTYDAQPAGFPNESFEDGFTDWDVTAAPHARVAPDTEWLGSATEGHNQIAWEDPVAGEEIISPWQEIAGGVRVNPYLLRADKLWGYDPVYGGPGKATIRVRVEHQETSTYPIDSTFQDGFLETPFVTPASGGHYRVRVQIVSFAGRNTQGQPILLDEISLRPFEGPGGIWLDYNKARLTVKNGSVVQGPGGAIRRAAVGIRNGSTVQNMNLVANGFESGCVGALYAADSVIRDSTCMTRNHGVFSRMQISAAITVGSASGITVENNVIDAGTAWGCIFLSGGSNAVIRGNQCQVESSVTNHHGIVAYSAANSSITQNTVAAIYGQGVLISGTFSGIEVANNTISLDGLRPNAEYGLFSFDAIRFNDYGNGNASNNSIRDNSITIRGGVDPHYTQFAADTSSGRVLNGIMNVQTGTGNTIERNTIDVQTTDPLMVGSCAELGSHAAWRDNVCRSNNTGLVVGGYAGAVADTEQSRWSIEKLPGIVGTWATIRSTRAAAISGVHFVDAALLGGAAWNNLSATTSPYEYFVDWSLTLTGSGSAEIRDASSTVVWIDTAPAVVPLTQTRYFGGQWGTNPKGAEPKTPHTVNGVSVTMDAPKTMAVP